MIIDNEHAIQSALTHRPKLIRELVLNMDHSKPKPGVESILALAREHSIPIHRSSASAIKQQHRLHYAPPILAIQKSFSYESLQIIQDDSCPLILALDHIEDPHNFGAIVRSAMAFGVDHILVANKRQCPVTSAVINASAGSIYTASIIQVSNLSQTLKKLKQMGYWAYGADHHTPHGLNDTVLNFPMVLVVGNEGKGIAPGLQPHLDERLKIGMTSRVESLNVSVATGILLHRLSEARLEG